MIGCHVYFDKRFSHQMASQTLKYGHLIKHIIFSLYWDLQRHRVSATGGNFVMNPQNIYGLRFIWLNIDFDFWMAHCKICYTVILHLWNRRTYVDKKSAVSITITSSNAYWYIKIMGKSNRTWSISLLDRYRSVIMQNSGIPVLVHFLGCTYGYQQGLPLIPPSTNLNSIHF